MRPAFTSFVALSVSLAAWSGTAMADDNDLVARIEAARESAEKARVEATRKTQADADPQSERGVIDKAASADDTIKVELDNAKATYNEQVESAKRTLLKAAEAKLKEYVDKGDFESVKEIKSQKEAFDRDGTVPSSGKLTSARSKYEAQMRAAKAALLGALQKAKSEYTKAQMFSEAETINGELQTRTAGDRRLVLNASGESSPPSAATSSQPLETAQSQKMPDVAKFEKFLAQYDRAWKKEQERLVLAIETRKTLIKKSTLDGDERIRRLDVIEKDLQAFKKSETLPNSDDLLDVVVELIEGYQKVAANLETTRAHWSDRAVKLNDPGAIAKLKGLEQRLDKIIGGREQFATGSKWSGTRQTEAGALQIILTVSNCTGTSFVGEMRQTAGGPGDIMKVEGTLDRNKVSFHTTEMLRGKNRKLGFSGYLLSDRIITNVEGIQVNGKPATGWMSLWREGAGNAQVGRRGKAAKH